MKKAASWGVVLSLITAVVYFVAVRFFPSEDKVIRQRLQSLSRQVSFNSNEADLERLAKVRGLAGYFAPPVGFQIEGYPQRLFQDREEFTTAALAMRSVLTVLEVEFLDPIITVAEDKQNAECQLTLRARALPSNELVVQELKISLVKQKGKWLVQRLATVKTLR